MAFERRLPIALLLLVCAGLWVFAAGRTEPSTDPPTILEALCRDDVERPSLDDLSWVSIRADQPELWARALNRCATCPNAVNCGPVLSIHNFQQQPEAP